MVTIKPFSKIPNNSFSVVKLKPKLPHVLNFTNIFETDMKRQTKMAASIEHQYHNLKIETAALDSVN